ncbi:MAG: PKD domain-containing protein [Epsilonproteobacteria bacterium]|nr:PKD domain-containing protein [Campylobacterota bacterium]
MRQLLQFINLCFISSIILLMSACSGGEEELDELATTLGINTPPIANAGVDKNVQVNETITIVGSGSDSDGVVISYEWKSGQNTLSTSSTLTYTPTTVGTESLLLVVTDDDGATATDTMDIVVSTVTEVTEPTATSVPAPTSTPLPSPTEEPEVVNQAPTANAGLDKSVQVNESITITGSGSDSDGTIVSYVWTKGSMTLSTSSTFDYIPTVSGTDTLTLTVTDDDGATATDSISVVVTEPVVVQPQIPTLSSSTIQAYLSVINQARSVERSCGTAGVFAATTALSWSDGLYKASYEHSYDMATSNTFNHNGSGTVSDWTGTTIGQPSTMVDRLATYGYTWSQIAENIGAGTNTDTAQEIVSQLLDSDGHCANIMNPNFTQFGMAMVKNESATYTHYWTQNFARP